MKIFKMIVLISVLFMASACSKATALEPGSDAADFTLTDIEGKAVTLSAFKGKVIILNFFASWCPPCRQEVPDFIALRNEYGDKGLAIVGVALVSQMEAKDFARGFGINYPVVIDDEKVSGAYGPVRSIPTTFIIGKDFKIAKVYIGFRPKEVFEKDVRELLR